MDRGWRFFRCPTLSRELVCQGPPGARISGSLGPWGARTLATPSRKRDALGGRFLCFPLAEEIAIGCAVWHSSAILVRRRVGTYLATLLDFARFCAKFHKKRGAFSLRFGTRRSPVQIRPPRTKWPPARESLRVPQDPHLLRGHSEEWQGPCHERPIAYIMRLLLINHINYYELRT